MTFFFNYTQKVIKTRMDGDSEEKKFIMDVFVKTEEEPQHTKTTEEDLREGNYERKSSGK